MISENWVISNPPHIMDLGFVIILLGLLGILFIITHLRPLNNREIQKLSQKRRKKSISQYFAFDKSEFNVNKEFKQKMKADGRFYQISEKLFNFPAIAAALLKYKKHEWIIIAFEKNKIINYLWLNKGFDRNCVSCVLSVETISRISQNENYSSILIFHNHPNSNPNQYDCSKPSQQDIDSAQFYSKTLNGDGINLIEFVCERGRHYLYYSSIAESFLPLKGFIDAILQKNGTSKTQNLILHIERFI